MRPIPVLLAVLAVAALGAVLQVTATAPEAGSTHPLLPAWALFSFAVSAFRGPLH